MAKTALLQNSKCGRIRCGAGAKIAFCLALSVALVTVLFAVPEEYRASVMDDWTSASFVSAQPGTELSRDLGASGGNWGEQPIPSGATAVVATDESSTVTNYLAFDTSDSLECLCYTATSASQSSNIVANFSMLFTKMDSPFEMSGDVMAALSLVQPDGESPHFVGYCRTGWVELYSSFLTPAFDTWYTGQARFRYLDGKPQVSYWIRYNGIYQPMTDASTNRWLEISSASEPFWDQVSFKGVGGVSEFDGEFYGAGLRIGVKAEAAR